MTYRFFKRAFDICCAFLGMVVTLPFWIIAVIGIEISDPGPVFYMAKRVGKDNKSFSMFKFRSMRVNRTATENNFKPDQDRIFPFGKFIRASKLDELPQLINIFIGDMSIVGPRPASTDQVEMVRSGENAIAANVASGLTGPSALYDYIYGDTIEDEQEYREKVLPTRLALDVWYVRHMNYWLDIKMIWWTVLCILAELFHGNTNKMLEKLVGYADTKPETAKQEIMA